MCTYRTCRRSVKKWKGENMLTDTADEVRALGRGQVGRPSADTV
jgi:hypothetical protein